MCLYLGDIIATSLKGRQTRIGFKGTNERYTIKLLHRSKRFTRPRKLIKSERLDPVLSPTVSPSSTASFIPYVS